MNKENLISAVRNPTLVPVDLDSIVQTFPYFQTARVLSAKNSKSQENHLSDSLLRTASAFSVDRTRLFILLNERNITAEQVKTETILTENIDIQAKENHEDQVVAVNTSSELKNEEKLIPSKSFSPIGSKVDDNEALTEIMKEILANLEALKASKKLAQEDFAQVLNTTRPIANTAPIPNFIVPTYSKSVFKVNSFVTPVDFKNLELQDGRLGEAISGNQLATMENYLLFLRKKKTPIVDEQSSVIESFIKRNPSISKPTEAALAMSKADFSQQSTKETTELVTENLASIFVKQKKYLKAIEIYQKLRLKYPEKSAYFAQKITELQNL